MFLLSYDILAMLTQNGGQLGMYLTNLDLLLWLGTSKIDKIDFPNGDAPHHIKLKKEVASH